MRYVICSTPRTGSNALCDCLVQTGVAGMTDLYKAGFFIGFGADVARDCEHGAVDRYFRSVRTPNGVEGCKIGLDYILHLTKILPFGDAERLMCSFDRYIFLTREDVVAQAVSRLFARQSGIWQSGDKVPRDGTMPISYKPDKLAFFIADTVGSNCYFETWFEQYGIEPLRMTYEVNAKDWTLAVRRILDFINVPVPDNICVEPRIKKQHDPRKAEFIARYRSGDMEAA